MYLIILLVILLLLSQLSYCEPKEIKKYQPLYVYYTYPRRNRDYRWPNGGWRRDTHLLAEKLWQGN